MFEEDNQRCDDRAAKRARGPHFLVRHVSHAFQAHMRAHRCIAIKKHARATQLCKSNVDNYLFISLIRCYLKFMYRLVECPRDDDVGMFFFY